MSNMQFIRISNFSDSANKLINQAIYFSRKENCGEINLVHLFLAYLDKSDNGKRLLDKLDITFDMVLNSYKTLASQDKYGTLENADIPVIEEFSNDAYSVIANTIARQAIAGKLVDDDLLFETAIKTQSDELVNFIEYIGLSIDNFNEIREEQFYIPDELKFFAEDLNETVINSNKYISNVDKYTEEIIEVLNRKIKANPCLVGEAGVGKTTIVYDLANRIVNGNAPKNMLNTHIVYINSSLLTAGTRYRGDFEERMAILLDWASHSNVILFLDEIHTFIDLNKSNGSSSTASNMIKKYLSDGTIKIIGTTTLSEYHKFIEKDKAFDRRIQKLVVKEPSRDNTIDMIVNTIGEYENFHNMKINKDTIEKAVDLSIRFMKNKFLPDKAYTILDQAASHAKLQDKDALTIEDIELSVSKITGINIHKLKDDEVEQLISLESIISKQLIGQENAVSTVCKAIRRSKTGVNEPNRPIASFMFVGPTGVGKTELCRILSKEIALGDIPLIKVDMSEYSEKYSISKMIGSAPGYIGYKDGGQLTEKIKNNPYSILLFDEIEKAHPDVYNIFLQMLDEGKLTDSEGETADLTNCIVIMTSNAGYGADNMSKGSLGFCSNTESINDIHKNEKIAMKALEETFKPEFLNRLDNIVIFDKLTKEQCEDIVKLLLNKLKNRVAEQGIELKFCKSVISMIVENGYSDKYGARNIKREIQNRLEDVISDAILDKTLYKGCTASVKYANNQVKLDVKERQKQ